MTYEEAEEFLLTQAGRIPRLKDQYATGVVNPIVLATALGTRPQMIYQYIGKGKIVAQMSETQKIVIDWQEAVKFTQTYIGRKQARQDKIEKELRGER